MKLSRYTVAYPSLEKPEQTLLYSTLRGASVIIGHEMLEAIEAGTLPKEAEATLARLGFLVEKPEDEQLALRNILVQANAGRRLFSTLAVLNLDCNLDCGYCFEGHVRGPSLYMSEETADLLVATTIREQMHSGNQVKFSFYGGEPLLSSGIIKRIAEPLAAAARQNEASFTFSLITNGTLLTPELARELKEYGLCGAKFTLDGPQATHDASRPFAGGAGSFDAIVDNLAGVCDLIQTVLGGNFTRDNYRSFPLLLDELAARGIGPDRLAGVQFVPVVPKAGTRMAADFGDGCSCCYEPWMIEAGAELRAEIIKRGFPTPRIRMSACMIEYDNDLVVNFDGRLYKCPAFMAYPELCVGTLRDGLVDHRRSHGIDVWKNDDCLNCRYLPLCFGGCRNLTLLRTGKIEETDCRMDYYDAALERLIRQDLDAIRQPPKKD